MNSQKSATQRRLQRWWHLLCNLFLKKLFLEDDSFSMQIEVPLTTMPLRVDFLLEQTSKTVEFANPLTANFRRYNMIEFKSPEDYVSMEDFYRGIAYVRLYHLKYHSDNYHVLGEVTMTFICSRYPQLLFKKIQEMGYEVKRDLPIAGVYRILGEKFPIQVVVMNRVKDPELLYLMSPFLTGKDRAGGRHFARLVEESIKHPTDLVLQQLIQYSLEYGTVPKREWEEVINMLTGKRLEKRKMELLEVTRKSWLGEMIKEDAFIEGKLEGKLEGQIEVVQKALQSGLDITLVAQITPFSVQEILQIQKELQFN